MYFAGARRWRISIATAAALLTAALGSSPPSEAAIQSHRRVRVIVQAGSTAGARAAVAAVRGEVTTSLPIVRGVAARVPAASLAGLRSQPGVVMVTMDGSLSFQSEMSAAAADFTLTEKRIPKIVESDRLWNEGITGRGVTVALLDTGIYSHPDLAGRILHCEDFSHEAGTPAECADTFGHGTFMAGLIAGNGASSAGTFMGTAPEANLVSVKVAGFDGATDVSHVLAGLQWIVAHRSTYGIDVINLSLGTNSTQSYLLSPLNYAVQKAWKSGLVVVVSAGNSGPNQKTILKPADDPYVVTIGASNDEGTLSTADDRVPAFSGRGPTSSNGVPKPDVVAPGVHTISLRSPGSAIDQLFGSTAVVQDGYFRGTGTSMSAATSTGVAAQIIQANPSLDPDQVKYRLMNTTRQILDTNGFAAGKGSINAYAAARSTTTKRANQGLLLGLGNGLGSLQASRGGLNLDVYTPMGEVALTGEKIPLVNSLSAKRVRSRVASQAVLSLDNPLNLLPWVGLTYVTTGWDPLTWALTSWVTADWTGVKWKGVKWKETTWDGVKWKGTEFVNADWTGVKWKDVDWDGIKWKATTWQTSWYAAAWD